MTVQQKIISNKVGLLALAEELGNVSKACRLLGFSRDTFYRYRDAKASGGLEALHDQSRRKSNLKNRVSDEVEARVVQLAIDEPALGQGRASNELRKLGIFVSPAGVRCVWMRHNLETFQKRLVELEKKVAETSGIYTERQMAALERKREEEEACGEIETMHPGYLGSQDTFYVGTLKGVGRVYQQTFVDTYSKVACAKLYQQKTPITSADLLNDRVLPMFEAQGIELLRILTDRGTEFCGKPEHHDYELYLAVNEIEHTRTKARHPQTNGICERFHRTILHEFYQVAFRRKVYRSIEELQIDLDDWIKEYNERRTHTGKMCNGRTPMETLVDGLKICLEKTIGSDLN